MTLLARKINILHEKILRFFCAIKSNKNKIFKFLLIALISVVLISNSGYGYSTKNSSIFVVFLAIATVVLIGLIIVFCPFKSVVTFFKEKEFKKRENFKLLFFYFMAFIYVLAVVFSFILNIRNNDVFTILHYVLLVVFSFSFTILFDFQTFKKYFVIVAEIVCIYSLILYAIDLCNGSGIYTSRFSNVVNHSLNNFLYIHFSMLNEVHRNCGPFWEPGLFATYCLVAIVFTITDGSKKANYFALILFIVATITTFSTAGILLLLLLIPVFFYEKIGKDSGTISLVIFLAILSGVVVLSITGILDSIPFFSKLSFSNLSKASSFGTRIASISLDLKIFSQRPIFGAGPNYFDDLYSELAKGMVDAQTSTIFWFAGSFGIIGFFITLIPYCSIMFSKNIKSSISGVLLSLIYSICLLKEPHYSFAISWIISFYIVKNVLCNEHQLKLETSNDGTIAKRFFSKKGNESILLKNASGTSIIKILSMAVGLVATPVYLAFFANPFTLTISGEVTTIGKVTFGIWSTILSILVWILHFDMGVGNGLKNKIVEALAEKDKKRVKKLITSAYVGNAIISLLILIVGIAVVSFIDVNTLFGNNNGIVSTATLRTVLIIVIVSICLELFLKVCLNLYQSIQKQTIASLVPLISTILLILMCMIVRFDNPNKAIIGISLFYLVAINLPLIVASLVLFTKHFKKCFSFKYYDFGTMKEVMKLGGLFFLIQIFILVYNSSDQILISRLWGPNFAVDYKYYYEFYFAVAALCSAISLPIWSITTKAISEKKFDWAKKLSKKLWLIWLPFVLGDVLIFSLLQIILNIWLGSNSIPVNYFYSLLFAMWSMFTCLSYLVTGFANGLKSLKTQLFVMGIGAIAKIPLVILLHNYTNIGWISVLIPSTITIALVCIIQPIENYRSLRKKLEIIGEEK